MNFELQTIKEGVENRYVVQNGQGDIFTISPVLYHILEQYKINSNYNIVVARMNQIYNTSEFTLLFIENTIKEALSKISSQNEMITNPTDSYVKGKITIVKEGKLQWLYKWTSLLFYKKTFTTLAILSLFISVFFFYYNNLLSFKLIYQSSVGFLSVKNILFLYVIFVFIILIHEIGHASASYHFGVKPKEIGFGFYFIFPVFYTNVTNIWLLNKQKRLVVNMAGIYFQLLINVILITTFSLHIFGIFCIPLIIANSVSITMSIIPFFRYDGYWLFSDYFSIPNLQSKARQFIASRLYIFPKKNIYEITTPLTVYAIANVIFWLYVYAMFFIYIKSAGISAIEVLFEDEHNFFSEAGIKTIVNSAILLLTIYLFVNQIVNLSKTLYLESRKISQGKK